MVPELPVSDLDTAAGGLGHATVLLVYMTEGLFQQEGTLSQLELALRNDVNIVWVAETDMRHGWVESWSNHSSWRDALQHMCSIVPAHWYEQGLLQHAAFDRVIPFYKDKAFRQVSLQCIIERMGAHRNTSDRRVPVVQGSLDWQPQPRISEPISAAPVGSESERKQGYECGHRSVKSLTQLGGSE
eukprot:COSAG02_NODE_14055_length_1316_cov_1.515201_1_plen_186_part_00